ncbi:MAG: SCO family protein [Phycisphaerales bacterium]
MNPKVLLRSALLLAITFIAIAIFWFTAKPTRTPTYNQAPTPLSTDNPYSDLFIPAFKLTDSAGNQADESILDGHYTVLDFFYTSCPLICPTMSAAMKKVQAATDDTNLQLLSVSIDPQVDTPEVIAKYAHAFEANPDRWRFLTGDMQSISLMLQGMNFDISEVNTDDGFRDINHPARLILIGPDRHAIKLYSYADPDQLAELIETARKLAG